MCDQEYQMAMQERQKMLEEALHKAEQGKANEDDWKTIYFECGLRKEVVCH